MHLYFADQAPETNLLSAVFKLLQNRARSVVVCKKCLFRTLSHPCLHIHPCSPSLLLRSTPLHPARANSFVSPCDLPSDDSFSSQEPYSSYFHSKPCVPYILSIGHSVLYPFIKFSALVNRNLQNFSFFLNINCSKICNLPYKQALQTTDRAGNFIGNL